MRTETLEIKIYKFDELPEDVKQTVVENWRIDDEFFWSSEWRETLEKFCNVFTVDVRDWEVNLWGNSFIDIEDNQLTECDYWAHGQKEITGIRLWKYLKNNGYENTWNFGTPKKDRRTIYEDYCLTGYCGDHWILEPLIKFMKKPYDFDESITFYELIKLCCESWLNGYLKDLEYWCSEECIKEDIQANEYEFTEDGKIY